jgi:hypothetical protein
MRRALLASIAILTCVAPLLGQANAPEDEGTSLVTYCRLVAGEIDQYLQQRGVRDRTVAVAFNGPATWKSSGGFMLVESMKPEFEARKIKIDSPANFAFKGDYRLTRSGKLRITGTLVDRLGDIAPGWFELPACVEDDPKKIATIMGLSADLRPGTVRSATDVLKSSFLEPRIAVTGDDATVARPDPTSPFGVQVLVGGKAQNVSTKGGLAFVDLDLDDTYALKIVNDANHEVAAAVSVDGLSVFHFSEQRKPIPDFVVDKKSYVTEPLYRYYIFAPRSNGLVQGWDKNATTVRAFQIVPFEESAAVQSGQTTDVGMITVSFHASWEKGKTPPGDEDLRAQQVQKATRVYIKNKSLTPDGKETYVWRVVASVSTMTRLGTGFGHDILVSSSGVQRDVGAARGLVTIRYVRKK